MRSLRNHTLLAATALVHGAAVLTYNQADFAAIASVLPVRFLSLNGV
jgi:predicted nucleic acid-binding protein